MSFANESLLTILRSILPIEFVTPHFHNPQEIH